MHKKIHKKLLQFFLHTSIIKPSSGGLWCFDTILCHLVVKQEGGWAMRGEYQHSIDTKGRVIFPVKLREELGEGFVIAKGLDNCISVYSKAGWDEFYGKISAISIS